MPIRIIILCFKRWGNVNAIVKALHKYFPITVINNLEGHTYTNPDAEVINNDLNKFCMERWLKCYSYPEPFKLILDDDTLISPNTIKNWYKEGHHLTGIFGYKGVNACKNYHELERCFNKRTEVDFLVGCALMIRQESLNKIKKYLIKSDYPKRGDDILVSYLIKKHCNTKLYTQPGEYLSLPEHNVGLNLAKEHFSLRWQVVEKFKKLGWT